MLLSLEAAVLLPPLLVPPFLAASAPGALDPDLIRRPPAGEPDGSRTLGIVPPFHGQPNPPRWLRHASHALVVAGAPNTRHYLYQAYADGGGHWLVRYVRYPDGSETCAETRVAFLFGADPLDPQDPPRRIAEASLSVRTRRVEWEGRSFVLVDQRDLLSRPATRSR
jgi:hypothetical protein